MNWRPGNWENPHDNPDAEHGQDEAFEEGASAMHKADVDFLRLFYPDCYFKIQSSMTKEKFEDWIK